MNQLSQVHDYGRKIPDAVKDTRTTNSVQRKKETTALRHNKVKRFDARVAKFRGDDNVFIYRRVRGNIVIIKDGFTSYREAYQFLENNQDDVKKLWDDLLNPAFRRAENRPRIGPHNTIATYKDLTPLFSVSGVVFGKSMPNSEKDAAAMLCAEAFLDMSRVLDIDPAMISLGSRLGMAFGSHGRGGKHAFSAVYMGGEIQAIALTRKAGAGCLAHEWMHAADDYLSDGAGLMSREEHNAEMAALVSAIESSGLPERSKEADKARRKLYYNTITEMIARVFEHYVHSQLEALGQVNDYLVSIHPDAVMFPTPDEAKVFAPLVRALITSVDTKLKSADYKH